MQIIEIWQSNSSKENTPMAPKYFIPMATHSSPVPTHLISICKWFSAWHHTNSSQHIYMLIEFYISGTICKYENGTLKVVRNAFNIGEVWYPVCCHGNKIVTIKLWSTFSRIRKESNISDTNWPIYLFIIFDQNLVEYMTSSCG